MRLSEYFKTHDINRAAFCRRFGISPSSLANYMRGRIPSLKAAILLVEATNGEVTYHDLSGEFENV